MSKEYIDKDAALNILKELHAESESPSAAEELFNAHERIGDIHPADVRPVVRGEWKPLGEGKIEACTNCGYQILSIRKTNFCPNCGADMRKEKNDE